MRKRFLIGIVAFFVVVNVCFGAGDDGAVFGCYQLTMKNFSAAPRYNGTYVKNNVLHIRNGRTNELITATTDENGFFYVAGLERFTPYSIEKFVIYPNDASPDYNWEWNWSIDFMIANEDVKDLGDIHTVWDAGDGPSSQDVSHGKAVSIYEKKFNASYAKVELKAGKEFAALKKYKNDVPDSRVVSLLENKALKRMQKNNPKEYIASVCKSIESWAKDDFDKIKLAHDVVALVLTYDVESYFSGKLPAQDYESVLVSGVAVCSGYSDVFKEFCDSLRVPCVVVRGFAKGVGYDPSSTKISANHDWNLVQVNGGWYFVDCTWDSGYVQGRKNVKEYTTDYLFLEPERAIYSHYPEKEEYQLLDKKFTDDVILFVPNFIPKDFNGKRPFSMQVKSFNAVKGEATLVFKLNGCDSLEVSCSSPSGKDVSLNCVYSDGGKKMTVSMKFKEKGMNTLNLKYRVDGWIWTENDFASFNWNP